MSDENQIRAALAANPFPSNPWVQVTDDGIIIKAGYSDTLHRMLRWVPKVQWVPAKRHWRVPLAGAELIRSVLPEISRLAEATHEEVRAPLETLVEQASGWESQAMEEPKAIGFHNSLFKSSASPRDLFRNSARFLYGTDWQRDTARALGRDEAALACWLVGEKVLEDEPLVLLKEMLDLMRQRAASIAEAADALEKAISSQRQAAADDA